MRIDDKEAQDFINNKLNNRESFYLVGIAGSGKSSTLRLLKGHGYKSCLIITPTNQLRIDHEKEFADVVDDFRVSTINSITQSVNRSSIDYDALTKDIKQDADIFILDEIYTLDHGLTAQMIEHINKLGKPYVILGDPWQDSIQDKRKSSQFLDNLEGLTLDKSLRGTESNRQLIRVFYNKAKTDKFTEPHMVANVVRALGGNVITHWPTDPTGRYGYTANSTQDELIERIQFTDKIFSGKVRYKQDGELSKQWANAPIVSQVQKQAIEAITGIKVPIATPFNTFNSKTCIGVEVAKDTPYYIILNASKKINTIQIYTLISRHKHDPSMITICLIDGEDFTVEKQYTRQETIADQKVIAPIRYITTTDEQLGLTGTGTAQVHVKLIKAVYKELLEKTGQPYTNETSRIYTESYAIEGSGFGAGSIDEYLSRPQEKQDATFTEKTTQMMAEFLQECPGLVCDPHRLHFLNDRYIDIEGIQKQLYIRPDTQEEPTTQEELTSEELLSEPFEDFLDNPYTEPHIPQELHKIDLNYAEWQIITNYSNLIGYGPMLAYDEKHPIHYGLVLYKNTKYILSSKVMELYTEAGVELGKPIWLASRPQLLSDAITDEAKQGIIYNRHIKYTKQEANGGWGKISKIRYQEVRLTTGEEVELVIQDNDKKSSLFTLCTEIKAIEALLVSLTGLTQPEVYTAHTDAVESKYRLNTDWDYSIHQPDLTYTHHIDLDKHIIYKNESHKLAILQQYLDKHTKDTYKSRWSVGARKVHSYLNFDIIANKPNPSYSKGDILVNPNNVIKKNCK